MKHILSNILMYICNTVSGVRSLHQYHDFESWYKLRG